MIRGLLWRVSLHASDNPTLKKILNPGNQVLWRITRLLVRRCFSCVGSSGCIGRIVRPSGCRIIRSRCVFPVSLLHLSNLSQRLFGRLVGELDVLDVVWTLSKGLKESYKYDLANLLVPLIALSHDYQNHSKWSKWGHVCYNLPPFGDWWQHNQSKHKFAKIDKLNHLHLLGCLPPSNVGLASP